MSSATDDIFQRLESAISEWSAEVKSSTVGITEKLARAKDRIGEPSEDNGELSGVSAALEFAQSEFTRLESALRETLGASQDAMRRTDAVEERLTRLNDDMNALREELQGALREQAERSATVSPQDPGLVAEVETLRAELSRLSERGSDTSIPEGSGADAALREELESLRADLAELRQSLDQRRDSSGTETGVLAERIDELEGLLSAERERTDQVARELSEVSEAAPSASVPQDLSDDVDALRQELTQFRSQRMDSGYAPPPVTPPPLPDEEEEEEAAPNWAPEARRNPAVELNLTGFDQNGRRLRMGDILVEAGVLTESQLQDALRMQEEDPQRRLGSILVELGLTESDVVAQVLACQLQLPYIRLEEDGPEEDAIRLVNGRLASHHRCIPVRVEVDTLVLAMANPLDLIAIEDVELATGMRVNPVVAAERDIAKAIDWFYVTEH